MIKLDFSFKIETENIIFTTKFELLHRTSTIPTFKNGPELHCEPDLEVRIEK